MAETDTTLDEALEAVLIRYGIPAYGLRKGVMEADRGDLASDLAEAARRTLALDQRVAVHLGDMDGALHCIECYDVILMLPNATTVGELAGAVVRHGQLGAALAREMGVNPPGAHLTADDPVPAWMLRQEIPA